MTGAPPSTARARRALLSLAALVLLGTVVLWVGTRGTVYRWGTRSLPWERGVTVGVGVGRVDFCYADVIGIGDLFLTEGFGSYPLSELRRAEVDEQPSFHWNTSTSGFAMAWCPVWFPGTLLGGVLLGWGLLCRRAEA